MHPVAYEPELQCLVLEEAPGRSLQDWLLRGNHAVVRRVARAVAGGEADQGVLFCWTGTGTSMAANKVPGVRAALAWEPWIAEGARKWNDANVLALSLRLLSEPVAAEILNAWLAEKYAGSEDESLAIISKTRWQASTARSPSSRTMPRPSATEPTRFTSSGVSTRRWPATTGRSELGCLRNTRLWPQMELPMRSSATRQPKCHTPSM